MSFIDFENVIVLYFLATFYRCCEIDNFTETGSFKGLKRYSISQSRGIWHFEYLVEGEFRIELNRMTRIEAAATSMASINKKVIWLFRLCI